MNEFLAYQLSGNIVQSTIDKICDQYNLVEEVAIYLANLNLDNAAEAELYNLGLWIGLPWPTTSSDAFDGLSFRFGDISEFPEYNPQEGFGDVNDPTIGGLWSSLNPTDIARIPIAKYRLLLEWFAYAKKNGITLYTIDKIAFVFSENYIIGIGDYFLFGEGDTPEIDYFHGFTDEDGLIGGALGYGSDPDALSTGVDISLIFTEDIGSGNLWVIQDIFNRLCTSQQVICSINV